LLRQLCCRNCINETSSGRISRAKKASARATALTSPAGAKPAFPKLSDLSTIPEPIRRGEGLSVVYTDEAGLRLLGGWGAKYVGRQQYCRNSQQKGRRIAPPPFSPGTEITSFW
jgi:hypothetical protein